MRARIEGGRLMVTRTLLAKAAAGCCPTWLLPQRFSRPDCSRIPKAYPNRTMLIGCRGWEAAMFGWADRYDLEQQEAG